MVKEDLILILKTFGFPVYLQGSLAADEPYPDSFFTFWNNETYDRSHFDDEPSSFVWDFTVYFYSKDPDKVNTIILQLREKLRENEWIIDGKGYDTPVDEPTHTGRAIDCLYIEKNTKESEGE